MQIANGAAEQAKSFLYSLEWGHGFTISAVAQSLVVVVFNVVVNKGYRSIRHHKVGSAGVP